MTEFRKTEGSYRTVRYDGKLIDTYIYTTEDDRSKDGAYACYILADGEYIRYDRRVEKIKHIGRHHASEATIMTRDFCNEPGTITILKGGETIKTNCPARDKSKGAE